MDEEALMARVQAAVAEALKDTNVVAMAVTIHVRRPGWDSLVDRQFKREEVMEGETGVGVFGWYSLKK